MSDRVLNAPILVTTLSMKGELSIYFLNNFKELREGKCSF